MTHIVCSSHGSAPNPVKFYFKEGFFSVLRPEGKDDDVDDKLLKNKCTLSVVPVMDSISCNGNIMILPGF